MKNTPNNLLRNRWSMNCRGRLLQIDRPLIMGILNITPDSFYGESKYTATGPLLQKAGEMLRDGADILDIGGMSSRPGAEIISEKEELNRIIPAIAAIAQKYPKAILSIDTVRAKVAEAAMDYGAHIVNDISAGSIDKKLIPTVARLNVPYILMHMQGFPGTMQNKPKYEDVVREVLDFFIKKTAECRDVGIHDIIIDPGFGFGKSLTHNYLLLKEIQAFHFLEFPVMVGISRKSMICKLLQVAPSQALNGTTVVHTLALLQGAKLLRVHDVKEAQEAISIVKNFINPATGQ